ncbi:MAG TPA: hypothetical protein VNG90_02400 [Candidatus Acidoferrum sp.]|nr:hypothetical protein [Candidatus Acidoferrum sp.]
MTIAEITQKILNSPKYSALDSRVVERVVAESVRRYGLKRAQHEAKRVLHQVWGVYFGELKPAKLRDADLDSLLQLHQSTRERLPFLRDFYEQIFTITGQPSTIVDYACGLNPLAFYHLGYDYPGHYQALDIDHFTVDLLNQQFQKLGVANRFNARPGDLLLDKPIKADIALLLKVLPPLELQRKGASRDILQKQNSRFTVVSYPLKSISGYEKGMGDFYRQQFYAAIQDQGMKVTELPFANELVFVIDKHESSPPGVDVLK